MRPNETVFQYLVAIRELANRGQGFLDETSIMEYCINGIPDSPSNKLILYGCTTIQEFKEKLGIYDKIFQNKSKNHSYDTSRSPNFSSQRRDVEIDTGSQVTLMKESVWNQLGSPSLINSGNILAGFGLSKTHVIGSFNSTVSIDNQDFPVKINVVPNHSMNFDIIIGCNLIKQANLTITPDSVLFSKLQNEVSDASPQPFVFAITDDIPKFDIGPEIPKQTRNDVEALLICYRPNKIKTTDIELSITVTDDKPIYHSPRRLPFTERDIVDKQIDEWIQNGVIEPCSSAYASQVLVVRKKDGSPRVCIDFRKLNRVLVKDHYPLPLIEDILDKLQDTRVFSTIDLRNGFFHVPVNKQSRPYTSFVTQNGQFQFLKMPFGLSTCPSTFQRFINTVFRDLVVQGIVLPYMDDIVILAKNESEAIERLKKVLQVSSLTGYFRKFIPAYSVIAKPLSDLLRKDTPFNFDVKQKASFDELKRLLCQKPVLGIYRQNCETEIHTDASIDGLAAVLLQRFPDDNSLHPIYYMSRKTSETERKYTSYELEVLAIIEALKKFKVYILGMPFKIITDCNAFTKTMSKKDLNTRIARWALNLQDYDYTILHRSGSQMAHVDALSRIQSGKQEGFLHPLVKDDIPLNTYHIDHLGPLATSSKNYKFILAVIDSFTKFVWLYPTKTTSTSEVIKKLDIQKTTFGNPRFLITDRGTTFTSDEFRTYCSEQKITLHHITTGLPRANGQVERINRTIIPVLSKMSEDDPTKWFKHVPSLQEVLNSTFQRSINTTPFELLFGTQINNKTDLRIQQLIDEQLQLEFNENRELLRKAAKTQILKVQNENKKSYSLRRKSPYLYSVKDLVAIKKTQQGPGQKLCNKFIGPYKITQVKPNDTYNVGKSGNFDGPTKTSTCAEYLKPWPNK
ncbi:retrovirus-related Pol polyprotein from transposon 297 [Trichonephila clavipes]|uniref:RNA-directed DNA polymerase n=1 Tax=Trichonephila clavipes TaxID=2585209 RepID=A0A8X6W0W5_TRICX|nr:retrovirus-related Pol polyprotein from transposon 297 [Trichonephila clavipes]